MVRQAMGGTTDAMVGRAPTPQQVAMGRQIEGVPGYQEAAGRDWERDIVAQAGGGMAGGDLLGGLTSRFTNPMAQALVAGAANTPGMGKIGFDLAQGKYTERDRLGLKAIELAAQGQPDIALQIAQSIGLKLTPAMVRNTTVMKTLLEQAKAITANDPAWGARFGASFAEAGDIAGAYRTAGAPLEKRTFQPITTMGPDGRTQIGAFDTAAGSVTPTGVPGYVGNRGNQATPAEIQLMEYLQRNGVAKDATEAFQLARTARSNPQAALSSIYSKMIGDIFDTRPNEQKYAEAEQVVRRMMEFGRPPSLGNAAPAAPKMADPLGLR
ncbi:MAG: hypothetical protein IT561_19430 [Alphaproteobacteria bacterium]|nr:hypothetical protein [Alphaproteobacteria bacterium]